MKTYFFKVLFVLILFIQNGQMFMIKQSQALLSAASYDVATSKDYAILAVASYCDRKCLENWNCTITKNYLQNDNIKNVTHFMGTFTRAAGFVAYDQTRNMIIVSLRGSANVQNWISDFIFESISYSKCKGCRVHAGFMQDYDSIKVKFDQVFDQLINAFPNAQILVTGHSMGAALSMIVGIQLKLKYTNKIVQIHNIGCPRVGNPSFAQFVQSKVDRVNRVVHNRDLIVHLPPLQLGYHHPSYEIFWDEPMQNYLICNQTGEDKTCSNQFSPKFKASDHDFYFWDLNKILKC